MKEQADISLMMFGSLIRILVVYLILILSFKEE